MLKRKYRFQGLGSIRPVMRYGETARAGAFTIKVLARRAEDSSRAGVVISRKAIKSAVNRNRLRRRIYEILRLHWHELNSPTDIAIIVHDPSPAKQNPNELEATILKTLKVALAKLPANR